MALNALLLITTAKHSQKMLQLQHKRDNNGNSQLVGHTVGAAFIKPNAKICESLAPGYDRTHKTLCAKSAK